MDLISLLGLFGFFAANVAAALSGAFFRPGEWYRGLAKPRWNPPDWLFGPAWAVLYTMIAVAGWLVWREHGVFGAAAALAAYGVQLLLNAAWSAIFFGLRRPELAFAELVVFWVAILVTVVLFWPLQRIAALLLLPYLAWVAFAGVLNLTLWRMNAGRA